MPLLFVWCLLLALLVCTEGCVLETFENTEEVNSFNELLFSHNFPNATFNIVISDEATDLSLSFNADVKNLVLIDSTITDSIWNLNVSTMPVGYVLPAESTDAPNETQTQTQTQEDGQTTSQAGSSANGDIENTLVSLFYFKPNFASAICSIYNI